MNVIGFFVLLQNLKCHKMMKKPVVLLIKSLKFQDQMKAEWGHSRPSSSESLFVSAVW